MGGRGEDAGAQQDTATSLFLGPSSRAGPSLGRLAGPRGRGEKAGTHLSPQTQPDSNHSAARWPNGLLMVTGW